MNKEICDTRRYLFFDTWYGYGPDRLNVTSIVLIHHQYYAAEPPKWSLVFWNEFRTQYAFDNYLLRPLYLKDGMQYELFNVTVFDQRDSKYIRETAKKYYSYPLSRAPIYYHGHKLKLRAYDDR